MSEGRVRRFEERLRRHAAGRLLGLALAFQAQAKRDYSVPNPAPHLAPAPPGRHPRARTYGGRDAVAVAPADLDAIAATGSVRVGLLPAGKHLTILARKGWQGLLDSYRTARPRLARLRGRLGL